MQEMQHFIGIDQDEEALEIAQARLRAFEDCGTKLHFVQGNFRCASASKANSACRLPSAACCHDTMPLLQGSAGAPR